MEHIQLYADGMAVKPTDTMGVDWNQVTGT